MDRGGLRVTRREAEVLDLVGRRLTNDEIASTLFVSKRTVESHVSALLRKFAVETRRELGERARDRSVGRAGDQVPLPAAIDLAREASPLLGRETELDALRRLWRRACGGEATVALITGEAGIGKSRLVAELAVEAHLSGAEVLLGSCFEDAPAAFGPFVAALGAHRARLAPESARHWIGEVPGLDRLLSRVVEPPSGGSGLDDPEADQTGLVSAIAAGLAALASRLPLVLVLEDVHWATASTAGALRRLARTTRRLPLLVIVTARDSAPDVADAGRALLDDLGRSPTASVLRLGGLDAAAVAELASFLGAPPDDPDAIRAETLGNPLFIREVAGGAAHASGVSLQTLVARRTARLEPDDNAVLDVAAVVGATFDVRLVAAAARTEVGEVLDVLERAEAAGLVWSVPGEPGQWSFVHALFRRVRYDAVGTARRMRIHGDVAAALAATSDADVADLARHAYESHLVGDARLTVNACIAAGDRAGRLLAVDEAVEYFRRAVDAASALDPTGSELAMVAAVRLGTAQHNAGDPAGTDRLHAAADEARRRSNGRVLGEIAWALSYYGSGLYGVGDARLERMVDDALALVGPGDTARPRLLGLRAARHAFGGDMAPVPTLCDEAVAAARATGDPITLAQVFMTIRLAMATPHNLDQRLSLANELEAIGLSEGLPTLVLYGRLGHASLQRERGDLAASSLALDDALNRLGASPPVWSAVLSTAMRSSRLLLAGDLAGAEAVANELLTLDTGARYGTRAWIDPASWRPAHLFAVRRYQGRLGEEVALAEASPSVLGPRTDALLTCALAHAGRVDEARKRLDRHVASAFADVPENLPWLSSMSLFAEAAELVNHAAAAEQLMALLSPFVERLDNFGDGSFGAVAVALSQLARVLGEQCGARTEGAVAICRRIGSPVLLGRALAYSGPAGVDESLAIAERTGARVIEQDVVRLDGVARRARR